jgi:hypothetical protein
MVVTMATGLTVQDIPSRSPLIMGPLKAASSMHSQWMLSGPMGEKLIGPSVLEQRLTVLNCLHFWRIAAFRGEAICGSGRPFSMMERYHILVKLLLTWIIITWNGGLAVLVQYLGRQDNRASYCLIYFFRVLVEEMVLKTKVGPKTRVEFLRWSMSIAAYTQQHFEIIQRAQKSFFDRTRWCIETQGGYIKYLA